MGYSPVVAPPTKASQPCTATFIHQARREFVYVFYPMLMLSEVVLGDGAILHQQAQF